MKYKQHFDKTFKHKLINHYNITQSLILSCVRFAEAGLFTLSRGAPPYVLRAKDPPDMAALLILTSLVSEVTETYIYIYICKDIALLFNNRYHTHTHAHRKKFNVSNRVLSLSTKNQQ